MNYRYLLAGILSLSSLVATAQQELTLHLMNNIYQSTHTNPALRGKNKVNVTLLSSYYAGVTNTGFNYNQIVSQVETDETGQKILDIGKLYHNLNLSGRDYANLRMSMDIFALSFRAGKGQFSLNISERFQSRLGYSDALLEAITTGNTPGQTLQFGGYWLKGMHYREVGLGYNRQLLEDDKLVVGGRIKTLFGMANVNTKKADLSIATADEADLYAITLNADMLVQTSGLETLEDDEIYYISNTNNLGLGLDLGATYQYNEKISFSGSIVDVGFINWKDGITNYQSNGSFVFEGISNDSLFAGGGMDIDMTQLMDSVSNSFEIVEDSSSYRTGLPTKMYLTGYYRVARNTKASVTIYTDFIGSFRRGMAIGISQRLGRWLQAAATYSVRARSYNNLGVGLTLTTGAKGLQIYAVTDNIMAVANPGGAKMANIRTGFNFVF